MEQLFQKIELRKVRDFGNKFNVTFEFIRQNYKALFTSLLLISGPFHVLGNVIVTVYSFFVLGSFDEMARTSDPFDFLTNFTGYQLLGNGIAMIGYLLSIVVVYSVVRLYAERSDPLSITVGDVWNYAKDDILPVLGAGILSTLVVLVALVFLVIPGIYLAVVLSLMAPIIVYERKSIGDAFSRSFFLIKEKWWSTFGLIVVAAIIQYVISMIFAIPTMIAAFVWGIHAATNDGGLIGEFPLWYKVTTLITSVIASLAGSMIMCITHLAVSFQYFNLAERRESTGLLGRLENFGKQETANDQNETY